MSNYRIQKSRVIKFYLPTGYDVKKINIGIPVTNNQNHKVGLKNIGDTVLPSADFGPNCKKNANGYTYSDRTQQKENRYIATYWIQPFGNDNASPVPVDMYRLCYPRVEVPPTEIELSLLEDNSGNRYIVANLTPEIRANHLKETVNLFLEIYGYCYIYSDALEINTDTVRQRCNWEILPPGEKPSIHLTRQLQKQGKQINTFDVDRLEELDKYTVEKVVEGINGFDGYFAYIFTKHCVLESAKYGNATYIIPKENWEQLSQKTKKELIDTQVVIEKIIHKESWYSNLRQALRRLEKQ